MRQHQHAEHAVGAVDQRQALLGRQLDRASSPAAASASAAGISAPAASRTSPSPISASAQCESGARSPEQPSEPYSCTTGVMPVAQQRRPSAARSRGGRRCARSPASRAAAASAPRTTSRSTSGPEPAACERTSERCSWARISVGMCRVASAPNPVEMPYAGVGAAASSSTDAAGPLDRGLTASGSSSHRRRRGGRPRRRRRRRRGPVPTVTGGAVVAVDSMPPIQRPPPPAHQSAAGPAVSHPRPRARARRRPWGWDSSRVTWQDGAAATRPGAVDWGPCAPAPLPAVPAPAPAAAPTARRPPSAAGRCSAPARWPRPPRP